MGWIVLDKENGVDESNDPTSGGMSPRVLVVCMLLLLASAINYMDRQTLASIGPRITQEFDLKEEQYGQIGACFGWGFAIGSLFFGFLVDYVPVRWLYPIGLLAWSAVGFMTAYVRGYEDLLIVRACLGFFEAVHWPCGLKTTQALLDSRRRGFGNSVLQSGTSIGACITPLFMLWILTPEPGSWRWGFQAVGLVGVLWIVGWFAFVRPADLQRSSTNASSVPTNRSWWRELLSVKFVIVLVMLISINTTWQILREWLPKILQQGFQYEEKQTLQYTSIWYLFTDLGCIASGALALALARMGWSIKNSRCAAYGLSALFCSLLATVPWLDRGYLLLGIFMLAGAGALGLFPMYYAFTQDISSQHQGKVTGVTGVIGWAFTGWAQPLFGRLVDRTKSYDTGLVIVGLLPLIALFCLLLLWPKDGTNEQSSTKST